MKKTRAEAAPALLSFCFQYSRPHLQVQPSQNYATIIRANVNIVIGGTIMHTQNTMPHDFRDYIYYLQSEERSPGTIANNLRHLRAFAAWLDGEPVDKVSVSRWKDHLLERGYLPATINGMLASLHSYFHFRGWAHCRVRYLRVQRKLFRADDRASAAPSISICCAPPAPATKKSLVDLRQRP